MLKILYALFFLCFISISSTATVRYVDATASGTNNGTSWANAYRFLSDALIAANSNTSIDTILVATGSYYPTGAQNGTNRSTSLYITRGGLKVYGGYPTGGGIRDIIAHPTYLDGNIGNAATATDNSFHIMAIINVQTDSVVVDGFTIRNGEASGGNIVTILGWQMADYVGAAIYVVGNGNGQATSISNCYFTANNANFAGGALEVHESGPFITRCIFSENTCSGISNVLANPVITNCSFTKNTSHYAGGIRNNSSSPLVSDCNFSDNKSVYIGGAVRNFNSAATYRNCTFLRNKSQYGGGMDNDYHDTTFLYNCLFIDDSAEFGGGLYSSFWTKTNIINCVFSRNMASDNGGGAYIDDDAIDTLTGCTFSENIATQGGGIFTLANKLIATNCTFWKNTAQQSGAIDIGMAAFASINNSILYGNSSDIGNNGNPGNNFVSYSLVQSSNSITNNNISGITNPQFTNDQNPIGPDGIWNTADDGLILSPCSPLLNIGYNSANNIVTDVANRPRIFNSIIDFGSYETQLLPGMPTNDTISSAMCANDSTLFNGAYIHTAGFYNDTLKNIRNCDSIITLHLTTYNIIRDTVDTAICSNQSYVFNGVIYTTTQTGLTDTFQTVAGCDSIVTLNLTVKSATTSTANVTICSNQNYVFNGVAYNTTQTLRDTIANAAGCDSIIIVNLTINNYTSDTTKAAICTGQSYTFNGNTYHQTVIVADTFTNIAGCDSIKVLNLAVNSNIIQTQNISICDGQTYIFNGVSYNTPQIVADTFTNVAGCDSITILDLSVIRISKDTINASICSNQTYVFNGISYNTSQAITDTFLNSKGCDSIVTVNLSVNNIANTTIDTTICDNQHYVFNGASYNTPQTIVATFATTAGCDSIVTVHLKVNSTYSHTIDTAICYGASYVFNGITYTTTQTIVHTFTRITGCDSTIKINLTVRPLLAAIEHKTICPGQLPYTWNGISVPAEGTAAATYTTPSVVTGCDSITTLHLSTNPLLQATQNITICPGQLPYTWNGTVITATGTNVATYTMPSLAMGCDSTTILNLSLSPAANLLRIDTSACGSLYLNGQTYTSTLHINDTLLSNYGCDSIYRLIDIVIYPNTITKQIIDTISCLNSLTYNGTTFYKNTTLYETVKSIHGCDSINKTVNIFVDNFKLNLTMDKPTPYQGQDIVFTTSANTNDYSIYLWTPASWFSDQNAKKQTINASVDTTVTVLGTNEHGCIDSSSITFSVDPLRYDIFVPNAFSPNGDGKNDYFKIRLTITTRYHIEIFSVYNRWGQLIYGSNGNDAQWDGTNGSGVTAEIGTYAYYIKVNFDDGHQEMLKGTVDLIR